MREIIKYPRTQHLRGSRFQSDDHDLEAVLFESLIGKNLIVEEKMDGANAGISFDTDLSLHLQSRGHYLRGGPREKHFALLKQWASTKQSELFSVLGTRYVMYGEWMFAKHTYFYDALPHYFMEFDVLDTETNTFLATAERQKLLAGSCVVSVKVLASGQFNKFRELYELLRRSNFITENQLDNLNVSAMNAGVEPKVAKFHTDLDERMEGLYVKWEERGIVKGRFKYVRDTFTNSILEQGTHWHDRPIIQNALTIDGHNAVFG